MAQSDRLVLTESSRYVLEADVLVLGGALSPHGGGGVFWSADTVWIAANQGDVRPICPERVRAPLGAAFVTDPSSAEAGNSHTPTIEIVDGGMDEGGGPRIIRFSGGECRKMKWSAPPPGRQLGRASRRWVFAAETDSGSSNDTHAGQVTLVGTDGHTSRPATIDLGPSASDSMAVVVSGSSLGIVVSSRSFPFAWTALGENQPLGWSDPGRAVSGRVPAANDRFYASDIWVGMGVFALDAGFVQILADLGSDRRHLLVYDAGGAFKRRRAINVPFGILDTVPDRRELLALRRTDRVELLTYRWSWSSTGPTDQHDNTTTKE